LLLAAFCLCAFAQNFTDLSGQVDVFADADVTLQNFVSAEVSAEVSAWLDLQPTAAQLAQYRAQVLQQANILLIESLRNATFLSITTLVATRTSLEAALTTALAAQAAFKAAVVANLTVQRDKWIQFVANISVERDQAVQGSLTLAARVQSALLIHVIKHSLRNLAASILRFRSYGEIMELNFRAARAAIWVINNTIATVNNSNVGGMTWANVSIDVVKEAVISLGVAQIVAQWKLNATVLLEAQTTTAYNDATAELTARVANFTNGVYASIAQVRVMWQATVNFTQSLQQRVKEHLENASTLVVVVTGLDSSVSASANISVSVTFDRQRLESTVDAAKTWVRDHLKILLVAVSGLAEGEVTVDAQVTASVKKRVTDTYANNAQLGNAASGPNPPPNNGNNGDGSILAYSAALMLSVILLKFF